MSAGKKPRSRVELVPFGKPDPLDDRTRGMLIVLVDGINVGDLQRSSDGGYIFVDGPSGAMFGGPGLTELGEPYRDRRAARRDLEGFVVRDEHRQAMPKPVTPQSLRAEALAVLARAKREAATLRARATRMERRSAS